MILEYLYLLDFIKELEGTSKCEIIDIADEEMKKIDSTEIDNNYKEVMTQELTKAFLNSIHVSKTRKEEKDNTKFYQENLPKDIILDIRTKRGYVFYKTKASVSRDELLKEIGMKPEYVVRVPIKGKYNFYMINANNPECFKW